MVGFNDNNNSKKSNKDKTVLISMISGIFAGFISKAVCHPIDTVKAKIQVNRNRKDPNNTIIKVFRQTLKNEGIVGLYRAFPIAVLGAVPGCFVYFGSYEYAKKHLLLFKNFSNSEFLMYFMSGMFAETVSCLIWVPVDVIKERRQVQTNVKTYNYKNDVNAFTTILQNEKLRGLYKAYGATVMSFGPMSAFYFLFYEYFKGFFVRNDAKTYIQRVKKEGLDELRNIKFDLSFWQTMICAGSAGALACVITNPLDLVKLRMQVQRADKLSKKDEYVYKNMFQGLYVVATQEGWKGLYKGCIARAVYQIPLLIISMSVIEISRPHIRKLVEGDSLI
jgi:hypothetical protein